MSKKLPRTSTKPVPRRKVIEQHPRMHHFPHAEVTKDQIGVWRFRENRIVNRLFSLAGGLFDLNRVALETGAGKYTQEELESFYMQIGMSLCGFADLFPDRVARWRREYERQVREENNCCGNCRLWTTVKPDDNLGDCNWSEDKQPPPPGDLRPKTFRTDICRYLERKEE